MTEQLAVTAPGNATALSRPSRTVLHPPVEPGQFRSHTFVHALRDAGLTGSMGCVGACGDNAAMESLFALLRKNVLRSPHWTTRQEIRLAITT